MTASDVIPTWRSGRATIMLIVCCAIFTYMIGLIARVPLFEDKATAITFSLGLDTVIVALSIVLINVIMRSNFSDVNLTTFVAVLVAALFCAALAISAATFIRYVFPFIPHPPQLPVTIFVYYTFLFCIWGMAACWIKMQARATEEAVNAADAARAAAVSELRRLRMQLDPHFLFNALNTALVEVNQQPKRAVRMLRELSSYLRYSLDTADTHVVPIAAELAMIRSFLRVQDIRFGARLKSSVSADEISKRRLVPTFLLLPLIENATKYGVPNDENILHVDVSVTSEDDTTTITVTNTGDLSLTRPAEWGTRTGLSNLQARLALHYPGRHAFDMTQVGEKVCVTCTLKGEPC